MTVFVDIHDDPNEEGVAFRRVQWEGDERVPGSEESGPIDSLADLDEALQGAEISERSQYPLDGLPTFGGEEPDDTREVFSWDAERLLVADGDSGFAIAPREEPRPR